MSEVYLTKIERKTIFTKSLIYVLVMFIISDLTVTGPYWVNFIPWLYVLAVLGEIKKIDKVLTCIIATFTVFISSIITQGQLNMVCVIKSVIALLQIIFGILTGHAIYQFILEHRLVKYLRLSKKIYLITTMLVSFVLSCLIVGTYDGNIFAYLKSKDALRKYISDTYNVNEFSITNTKLNRKAYGKYAHTAEIDGQEVHFVQLAKETFKDANIYERLDSLNNDLNRATKPGINDVLNKYPDLSNSSIDIKYEYTKVGITPDAISIYVQCNKIINNKKEILQDLVSFINDLYNMDGYNREKLNKIVIVFNNKILEIPQKDIVNLNYNYLRGGFEIEDLDMLGG